MGGNGGYTKDKGVPVWVVLLAIFIIIVACCVVAKADINNQIDSVMAEEWEMLMHRSGQQCGILHDTALLFRPIWSHEKLTTKRTLQMYCAIQRMISNEIDTITWHPPMEVKDE